MKEIHDIIKAYETALQQGKRMALATVVHVEGSSYRRPGARMLVTDDGQLTGAISGGCLEGDALRKALLAISQQKNKLVTYDTTDDDDTALGVQLGCNGIVHILFEPIKPEEKYHPLELLKKVLVQRQNSVLITLFSLKGRNSEQPGTCFLYQEKDDVITSTSDNPYFNTTFAALKNAAFEKSDSFFNTINIDHTEVTAFVEFLAPPPSLVIAGAGNDTIPLTEMASILGWDITVVDGRAGHATRQRFPAANHVIVSKAGEVLDHVAADSRTFFVLMTHNYNYDLALLKTLIPIDDCPYIGALGPRKKLERMYDDLLKEGISVTEIQKSKVFGPVGLDIGAETSEEIALSVLAEIKAVLQGKKGSPLREKNEPIHNRSSQTVQYSKSVEESFLCAIQAEQF